MKPIRHRRPAAMLLAIAIGTISVGASAQPEKRDPAAEFRVERAVDGAQTLVGPPLPVGELIARHLQDWKPGEPLRFAEPFAVSIDPAKAGRWTSAADGIDSWELRIRVPGAVSLNLGFKRYAMPKGGSLTIHNADRSAHIRPFTEVDNREHLELWTPLLEGEEVVLTVSVPKERRDSLQLELGSVNAGFTDFNNPLAIRSGSCNIDVVCPQGDGWRDQIRSVGAYSISGVDYCSGALVNNVRGDRKSYFLTANHCSISSGNQNSVVIYWNYQNSTCRPPGSSASGSAGDGSRAQFSSGVTLRANSAASDFALVETQTPVDPAFNLYWSGLDATTTLPTSTVGIHHPRVEEKRISFAHDPLTVTSYLGTTSPGNGTHLRVFTWQGGTTEGGSSGSPIYNPANKRIVGQLHGGYASCTDTRSDWYGWTNISWNGGGSASSQLKAWLDPDDTGTNSFDGRGLAPFTLAVDPASIGICASAGSATIDIDVGAETGFSGAVTLAASGAPTGSTVAFSTNPVTAPGSSVLTVGNLASAQAGNHALLITGSAGGDSLQKIVPFGLSVVAPGAATPSLPANGAVGIGYTPTLSWSAGSDAQEYRLEVSTDPFFATTLIDQLVTGTSYTVSTPLAANTVHYWRVTPGNFCGTAPTSAEWSFKTAVAPGQCDDSQAAITLFSDDVEGGDNGWTTTGSVGAQTWTRSLARPNSGTYAWYAENIAAASDQRLISPAIILPGDQNPLTLSFHNWRHIERSGNTACYDGGILEVSTDGGASFTQVPAANIIGGASYRGPISSSFGNPLAGAPAWCDDPALPYSAGPVLVDLGPYAGQTINLRFRLGTDSSVAKEGWYVDDITVNACATLTDEIFADGFDPVDP
ncbi:MAG TPA: immune inhibitor A [Dokdonella sp.]|uniref:immune inhibitor A domain-containing protein n=1 Tax=Dokdonella sp. TaxID=2291710 RepID=UPI0025B8A412|nr:immune inhibitor A domain-containing protein [Dokdonella sp.]MBX3691518.1 immune inhibitor A [Dokdonella sp.]MCW5566775.1 immune inhibitor A [Dokdonella sp.]HNR90987.1 immune inhibitor A [Dokdonella sp.]